MFITCDTKPMLIVLQVIQALVTIGKRLGVKYRFNSSVKSILLSEDGGRAIGVELVNGEKLTADVVINNSDLVYAYNNLLPKTAYARSLSERPTSCSSISFYWSMDRKVPQLAAHNIFLADEYRESFDAIFKKHMIPDEPSFYVNVPSRVDPTAAPEGKDTLVILVPVGHLIDAPTTGSKAMLNGISRAGDKQSIESLKSEASSYLSESKVSATQDWPKMIASARETIISTISKRIGTDIGPLIAHEITNDPVTWRERFNLDRGAILGLSHSFFNVLSFRPPTRARRGGALDGFFDKFQPQAARMFGDAAASSVVGALQRVGEVVAPGPSIQGLYFVGASTHPGTGVPICLAGGKLVAEQILDDYEMEVPWLRADVERKDRMFGSMGKTGRGIDVPKGFMPRGVLQAVFLGIVVLLSWLIFVAGLAWET